MARRSQGWQFIASKLGLYILIFWAAITLNFIIPRLMPGNPASALMAKSQGKMPPSALKALEDAFGINTHVSLWRQYLGYLRNTVTGHMGISFTNFPVPVAKVIGEMLPWTLFLIGLSTIIAFFIGNILGLYSAWRRGGKIADALPVAFTVISAMPYFWIALALLYFLGFSLNWFPISHAIGSNIKAGWNFQSIGSVIDHATLPAFSIVVTSMGGWMMQMRNNLISILSHDYVQLAQMKGLPEPEVMRNYGARNAMLPVLTSFAMSLGFVVGGAVLVEDVFNYPGIGYALVEAVGNSDYPLMQGIFLIIVSAVLLANLIVDLLYTFLDPRIRRA
ncbi:ABC transporter permease [Alicyclobacillus acidiphilus]|uniref:ABC transporter permease n=1 Tax=Alicyclobacillus acidiphilus TaxID=182455 RepID=UPI00082B63A9|nr:ABC transporter permease [Alicyclobacillus acidiphilus]